MAPKRNVVKSKGIGFHIVTTRPDFPCILRQARGKWPDAKEIGVFLCGPKAISKVLHPACELVSGEAGVAFYYQKESF